MHTHLFVSCDVTVSVPPGSVAKQAFRKQQLRTWKVQQLRKQEEDERHKREDEIRRIRDLSNQDEQYNRFMKLVGGRRTRSRVSPPTPVQVRPPLPQPATNQLCVSSPGTRTTGSLRANRAWTPRGTCTSTTTTMRLPWIRTARPAPQVSGMHLSWRPLPVSCVAMLTFPVFVSAIADAEPPDRRDGMFPPAGPVRT